MEYKEPLYRILPKADEEIDVNAIRRKRLERDNPEFAFTIAMIRKLSAIERGLEYDLSH